PREFNASNITDHTLRLCTQQFGEQQGAEAARILNLVCKYNGRCTPELLTSRTYDLASGEWLNILSQYRSLENEALRQFASLDEASRDAYRELILFPLQLMANLHEMYYGQAQNHRKGADMDFWAERCRQCFERDSVLMAGYNHDIASGKWNGMMIQKHIGYFSWNDNFPKDRMPRVFTTANTAVEPAKAQVSPKQNQICIEAEHYAEKSAPQGTEWTVIPHMGKWLSAMTLMPYTADVKGAWLNYKFSVDAPCDSVKVTVITKSTLDFLNKGGLCYSVSIDGCEPTIVNFNANLNEKPENIYSIYYPTVANRIVEKSVVLPVKGGNGSHAITFAPLDPAIVIERIVVSPIVK
ncbi:MAG: glycosyhydrolase, partial [Paludibacteraceae bacterium]|nr:glycosyhydrolase [Paludibacteraceae bacterium]